MGANQSSAIRSPSLGYCGPGTPACGRADRRCGVVRGVQLLLPLAVLARLPLAQIDAGAGARLVPWRWAVWVCSWLDCGGT